MIFSIIANSTLKYIIGSSIFILGSYTTYYLIFLVERPKISCGNKKLHKFLSSRVPHAQRTYWPSFFYSNSLLQTVFGLTKRLPPQFKLNYKRDIVTLSDGGEVALDFHQSKKPQNGTKLSVLFLPGLTSSSQTSYIKSLVLAIAQEGADVYVLNHRGVGGHPLKTPKSYTAANLEDLIDGIAHLRKHNLGEDEKFLVIGTSFGGIQLTRYLIKHPEEACKNFVAALLISSVFDLNQGQIGIESGLAKYLINYSTTEDMKRRMTSYDDILQNAWFYDREKLKKCKTVRDFDKCYTIKAAGFKSDIEFYSECSSVSKLHHISVPLFSLSACDDPMQLEKYLPFKDADSEKSKFALITTKCGGHLGFLEGTRMKPLHFMEKFTADFVRAIIYHRDEIALN